MEPNKTERTAEAAAPEAPQTPQTPKSLPVRRVGSLTLGVCLIAAGAFFLCYHFLPHFNWELALKIAPAAGLCLLGGEVLYFAAKPGKWKYDFLSVFFCLCLMAVCLCMSALPMVLDRIDPANEARVAKIAADYENTLYAAIRDEAYFHEVTAKLLATRTAATEGLRQRGFTVFDSATNFLFATTDHMPCKEIFEKLRAQGILIRHFNAPRISNYLRITIGTDAEMQRFFAALDEILGA